MTSLWNSNVREVVWLAPIPTNHEGSLVQWIFNVINLSWLGPEVFSTVKDHAAQPFFLSLRSILTVKLSSINHNWVLGIYQICNDHREVFHVVASKGSTNSIRIHCKNRDFSALVNMNGLIDVFYLCRDGEIISDNLLNRVPIITKDSSVIGKDIAGDWSNVTHDVWASFFWPCKIFSNHLLTVVTQLGDLGHVWIIKDIQSFRDSMHIRSLGKRGSVWVSDQGSSQVILLWCESFISFN